MEESRQESRRIAFLGITFQPWKALAVHKGLAEVTRRLMKQAWDGHTWAGSVFPAKKSGYIAWWPGGGEKLEEFTKKAYDYGFEPRYRPGDVCYVKEAWRTDSAYDSRPPRDIPDTVQIITAEDWGRYGELGRYRHARFMPRRFARTWVEMVDVRPERVQEITEEDAIAEGVREVSMAAVKRQAVWTERQDFAQLWDKLHPDHGWDSNPWVWRYQFRLTEAPDA